MKINLNLTMFLFYFILCYTSLTQNKAQNVRFRQLVKVINQKGLIECLMRKQILKTQEICKDNDQSQNKSKEAQNIILIVNEATHSQDCKNDSTDQLCIQQIQKQLEQMYQINKDQKNQQEVLQDISNTLKQYIEIAKQQFQQINLKIDKGIEEQSQQKDLNISLYVKKGEQNNQQAPKNIQSNQELANSINNVSQTVNNMQNNLQNTQNQKQQDKTVEQVQNSSQQKQSFLVVPVNTQDIIQNLNNQNDHNSLDPEMDNEQKQQLLKNKMENTFDSGTNNQINSKDNQPRNLMDDVEFQKRQKKFLSETKQLHHYENMLKDLDDKDEQLFESQNTQQNFQRAVKIQDCIDKISKIKGKIQERQLRLQKKTKHNKKPKNRKLNIDDEYKEEKMKSLILDRLEFIFADDSKVFSNRLSVTTKQEQYYLFNLFQQYELNNKKINFVSEEQKEFYVRAQQKIQTQQNSLKMSADYPENMQSVTQKLQETNKKRKDVVFLDIEITVPIKEEDKDLTQKALKYFYQEMSLKNVLEDEDDEQLEIESQAREKSGIVDQNFDEAQKIDDVDEVVIKYSNVLVVWMILNFFIQVIL